MRHLKFCYISILKNLLRKISTEDFEGSVEDL